MNLKKIWLSPDTKRKSRFGWCTLGGAAAIAALMALLIGGGTVLSFALDLPRKAFSLALCLGAVALTTVLALKLGQRTVQDATVFFLTEDDRLFALDARTLSVQGHGLMGYAEGAIKTQALLRRLAEHPFVPAAADEILRVEALRENRASCAIRCQVRHPNRQVAMRTYFLVRGIDEEELLLRQLERRQSWESMLDPAPDRRLHLLLSAAALAGLIALCVLSHPAQGKLPQAIYFPCLGAAVVAVFFVLYFIILRRRGE